MAALKLNLLDRETFARLSLHEKNDYLHGLFEDFCRQSETPYAQLDRDALARLRRFYTRRSLADLHDNAINASPLGGALRRLGEAIKDNTFKGDLSALMKAEAPHKPIMRTVPAHDAQLSFFVPAIVDAAIKDNVDLMDVAPFSLTKNPSTTPIRYDLKDCVVTVEGGPKGMATIFDYDIVLHMQSYLNIEFNRYLEAERKGQRPSLPPKIYQPSAAEILKFCRREQGGKQYELLEKALDRLQHTTIKVVNLGGGKRRQVDAVPLIGPYRVVSKTSNGHVDQVQIPIPDWLYNNIVNPKAQRGLLTIHPDYFLISQSTGRALYRIARKAAGKTTATYGVAELQRRMNSKRAFPKFMHDLRAFVANSKMAPLPDYDLEFVDGRDGIMLKMSYRPEVKQEPLVHKLNT